MVLPPMGGAGQGGAGGRGGLGQVNYEARARLREADRASLRRVAGLFTPYRGQVAAIGASVTVGALLGVLPPLLLKWIIDDALAEGDLSVLGWLCAAMIGAGVAAGAVALLQQWLSLRVGQAVMCDLRNGLYARVQAMPFAFFTRTRTGEITSRVLSDVQAAQDIVNRFILTGTQNALTIVVTVVVMVSLDPGLALVSLSVLPLFIAPVRRAGRIRSRLTRETQSTIGEVSAGMQESLGVNGVMLMKTFGREAGEYARFADASARVRDLQIRQGMAGRWFQVFVGLFASISPAVVLWYGGWQVTRGNLTIGDVVAFTALLARIYTPLQQLLSVGVDLLAALGLFARMFDYLDLDPDIRDRPDAITPPAAAGAISFDRVSFSYDNPAGRDSSAGSAGKDAARALSEVSFALPAGQMTALVGPSGAGKTTVSYLIARLYDPSAGTVRIDGHDLRAVSARWLAEQIAVVPQETFLFHTTVEENIRFGAPDAGRDDVVAAAQAANVHDVITALPDGYDTVVGERGFRLSGGERQRIAIARALLRDPRIILLDEATSALDSRSERVVREALDRLLAGRTSIVIAHRLSTVVAAEQILAFDQGRLIESGTHTELLARGGLYAQLHREQLDRPAPDRPAPDRPAPDRPAPDRPAPERTRP